MTVRIRPEVWNLCTHRCFRALASPREAFHAVRYVLENWAVHAVRDQEPQPQGIDPCCSAWWHDRGPPLVAEAQWWLLRVGVRAETRLGRDARLLCG